MKIKFLLISSFNKSLKNWYNKGIIERELSIYRYLSKKEFEVNILTYEDDSDLNYLKKSDNLNIIPLKKYFWLKPLPIITPFLLSLKLFKFFKSIDIVKSNQMSGSSFLWFLKILFKKKVILRCGYEPFKNALYKFKYLSKKLRYLPFLIYLFLYEWISYHLSDSVIVSNKFDKKFIIDFFNINPSKIEIIPNYIDITKFKPLPIEKKENKILFVGNLNEYKNLFNLIGAFKYLKNYSLDILGEGKLKLELKEKIKKLNLEAKIRFLGIYPYNCLPKIYNSYFVFILPSFIEGNPKVLIEAMSCGLICIGADTPGINQIIKDRITGFLCKKDDLSIANCIKWLNKNKNLINDVKKKARNYIINNYSSEKIFQIELEIYKKILSKNLI